MAVFVANAQSPGIGRKDIIKIDNTIAISFEVLGLIDPNIIVNIIENEEIREKIRLRLSGRVENILLCKNPRCIPSTEASIPRIFHLENVESRAYRREYCDEIRVFSGALLAAPEAFEEPHALERWRKLR